MLLASGSGCQMCDFLFVLFDFIFFKQKTAYELRISDWSSDVCSSDLFGPDDKGAAGTPPAASFFVPAPRYEPPRHPIHSSRGPSDHSVPPLRVLRVRLIFPYSAPPDSRRRDHSRRSRDFSASVTPRPLLSSEERRGGDECVSTFRCRWWP